jgi:hypothetical protein
MTREGQPTRLSPLVIWFAGRCNRFRLAIRSPLQHLGLLAQFPFADVGVERIVVGVSQESGNLSHRKPQFQ